MFGGFQSTTIAYPKPYRVPFCAVTVEADGPGGGATEFNVEIYYDEVKVSAREMAWLRRRTEVIRTT